MIKINPSNDDEICANKVQRPLMAMVQTMMASSAREDRRHDDDDDYYYYHYYYCYDNCTTCINKLRIRTAKQPARNRPKAVPPSAKGCPQASQLPLQHLGLQFFASWGLGPFRVSG